MKTNIHFLSPSVLLQREVSRTKVAVYQIMWKNIAEPDWLQMTMAHVHCTLDT
jgi:hypothetical protein